MVQVLRLLQVNRPTVSDTTVSLRPVARRADAMNATGLCDVGMVDHTVILELDPYVCFLVVLSGACAIGYRGMIFASSSLSLPGSRFPQTATLRLRVREDLKLKQKSSAMSYSMVDLTRNARATTRVEKHLPGHSACRPALA